MFIYLDTAAMQSPRHQVPQSQGCDPEQMYEAIDVARSTAPTKPVRAVIGWFWCDVFDLNEEDTLGGEPSLSFLQVMKVIFDDSLKSFLARSVVTSPLVRFHDRVIFETRNTSYVLVGNGLRFVYRDPGLTPREMVH